MGQLEYDMMMAINELPHDNLIISDSNVSFFA